MNRHHNPVVSVVFSTIIITILVSFPAFGQQSSANPPAIPPVKPEEKTDDTRDIKPKDGEQSNDGATRNDRIFGIIPNYGTVEGTEKITPISSREKYKIAVEGSFDRYEFAIVGLVALKDQATDTEPSLGQGIAGYAKRYGSDFANQAIGNVLVGGVVPSLLHEDPRYFQLGHGGFKHRFAYSFSRIFVIRTDAGGLQFNYSEFLGNSAAAGISLAYSPSSDRRFSNTSGTFLTQLAVDALGNELKEFWPDIRRKAFHKK
jgi:hypothetical protein